jgi:hypothetical protein
MGQYDRKLARGLFGNAPLHGATWADEPSDVVSLVQRPLEICRKGFPQTREP